MYVANIDWNMEYSNYIRSYILNCNWNDDSIIPL